MKYPLSLIVKVSQSCSLPWKLWRLVISMHLVIFYPTYCTTIGNFYSSLTSLDQSNPVFYDVYELCNKLHCQSALTIKQLGYFALLKNVYFYLLYLRTNISLHKSVNSTKILCEKLLRIWGDAEVCINDQLSIKLSPTKLTTKTWHKLDGHSSFTTNLFGNKINSHTMELAAEK